MSGLTASQLAKIRGERTLAPRAGDEASQTPRKEKGSDDGMPIGFDEPSSTGGKTLVTTAKPSKPGAAPKLKVHSCGPDGKVTALVILNDPWTSATWASKKVVDLRRVLIPYVKMEYEFCLRDSSAVSEEMPLADYLEETVPEAEPVQTKTASNEGEEGKDDVPAKPDPPVQKRITHNMVYLKARQKETSATEVLKKSFLIKFVDKGMESPTGSVMSTELPGNMNTVQLSVLRSHVNMSSDHRRHEFCFKDGTSVSDSMLLKTYVSKAEGLDHIDSDLPIITIYFQKVGRKSIFAEASGEMKDLGKINTKTDLTFGEGNKNPVTAEALAGKPAELSKLGFQQSFLDSLAEVKAGSYKTPAELDEMQWDTVLGNCSVMYGWKFDITTMSVKRAPQPAFKLRRGLNLDMNTEVKPEASISAPAVQAVQAQIDNDDDEKPVKVVQPPKVAFVSRRKKPDALPNYSVVDDSKVVITLVSSTLEESMAKNNFSASSFEVGGSANIKGVDLGGSGGTSKRDETGSGSRSSNTETLMVGHYRFPRASISLRAQDLEPTEGLVAAIEKVRVSKSLDQLKALYDEYGHFFCEEVIIGGTLQTSRVTKISDTYSISRAKSQFKSEVGIAVSIPKIFSINARYSKETGSDEEKSKQQTNANDSITFEATGGNTILATNPALWTESVLDYRNWRVIERTSLTPLGEMLHRCSVPQIRPARAWFTQAVPVLSKYIAIPESRIISVRLKLSSNVPQLNHQEGDPFDRDCCHYLGHQYGKCVHPIRVGLEFTETIKEDLQRQFPDGTVDLSKLVQLNMFTPFAQVVQGVKLLAGGAVSSDISRVFKEIKSTEEIALFTPARVQAPVALQYNDSHFASGVTKDQYKETVWNMIVPYGEWLQHDSLVMLTSATGSKYKDNIWLTVFRNAQGHFMPAITSSGDASFWRVKKTTGAQGSEISEGNTIKLTWRFSDQTGGFRDFYDDSFGRRTFSKPHNVQGDELYLKLPFPRFQSTATKDPSNGESAGFPMIMSGISTDAPILQEIPISSKISEGPQKRTYNLHDTSFRVDINGNAGLGELEDYMTTGLNQALSQTLTSIISERTEIIKQAKQRDGIDDAMDKVDQIGSALFGPAFPVVSSPAKRLISEVTGLFSRFC